MAGAPSGYEIIVSAETEHHLRGDFLERTSDVGSLRPKWSDCGRTSLKSRTVLGFERRDALTFDVNKSHGLHRGSEDWNHDLRPC